MFERLNSVLDEKPDQSLDAIQYFVGAVNAQKTDTGLVSTLFYFKQLTRTKKHIDVNIEALKRRKKYRKMGTTIKVSTEALKRRTTHLGGRRCQQTGRRPKLAFSEHGYNQKQGRDPYEPEPNKTNVKKKAPNLFAERVHALKQVREPPAKRAKHH